MLDSASAPSRKCERDIGPVPCEAVYMIVHRSYCPGLPGSCGDEAAAGNGVKAVYALWLVRIHCYKI
jgi:hypothetical protein